MVSRAMQWIKSGGGPLICVDRNWATCWRGVVASGPLGLECTDYERACAAKDYVNKLNLNGGSALILGDMPLETSVWSGQRLTIVRVFYADPSTEFDQIMLALGDEIFAHPIESTSYEVVSGRMVIFDSAADGRDPTRGVLPFDIENGKYKILTVTTEPNDRTSLLLHRFFLTN